LWNSFIAIGLSAALGSSSRLSLPQSAPVPLSFSDSADIKANRLGISEREASEFIEFPSRIPIARLSS
jgi:hypothetical protein